MALHTLPRLYPILDASCFPDTDAILTFARELAAGGAILLQYRNKTASPNEILSHARELRRVLGPGIRLIMNDRADLCLAAGFDGVHLGQEDLSADAARLVIGNERWVGVSTHNPDQLRAAGQTSADYLAIGPVFGTTSKANPDPVVGLDGVRIARALTRKPLVAIGGVTLENFRSVLDAGADSVAVISGLLQQPREAAKRFLAGD